MLGFGPRMGSVKIGGVAGKISSQAGGRTCTFPSAAIHEAGRKTGRRGRGGRDGRIWLIQLKTREGRCQPYRGPKGESTRNTTSGSADMCDLTRSLGRTQNGRGRRTTTSRDLGHSATLKASTGSSVVDGRIRRIGDLGQRTHRVQRHASWKGSQTVCWLPSALVACLLLLAAGLNAALSKSLPHFAHLAVLVLVYAAIISKR